MGDSKKPHCCENGCGKPADFVIYDYSTSCNCVPHERECHTCIDHVGVGISHTGEVLTQNGPEEWRVRLESGPERRRHGIQLPPESVTEESVIEEVSDADKE